jgi:hypothetical protein
VKITETVNFGFVETPEGPCWRTEVKLEDGSRHRIDVAAEIADRGPHYLEHEIRLWKSELEIGIGNENDGMKNYDTIRSAEEFLEDIGVHCVSLELRNGVAKTFREVDKITEKMPYIKRRVTA